MAEWESFFLTYRVDETNVSKHLEYREYEGGIPNKPGLLVGGSVMRVGGRRKPLYWSETKLPVFLGLFTVEDPAMPAKVISNGPQTKRDTMSIRVEGRVYDFSFEPIEQFTTRSGNYVTNKFAGVVERSLTTRAGYMGGLILRHQTTVKSFDEVQVS